MLSQELHEFCERWFQKSKGYNAQNIQECFDRFFTLFVVYNRLYSEMALSLARIGKIRIRGNSISDSLTAKQYIQSYLKTDLIWSALEEDKICLKAIESIVNLLENRVFCIKLDRLRGDPIPEKDQELLNDLKSGVPYRIIRALLDIIYSIRCNMFHGHKGFDKIQIDLVNPVSILLEKFAMLLFEKLSDDNKVGILPPINISLYKRRITYSE